MGDKHRKNNLEKNKNNLVRHDYICEKQLQIMANKKPSITPKMFKKLQNDLKELNMQWVTLLVNQILEAEGIDDSFKDVNDRKIYNVFNGVVKDGAWKLLVYKQGTILKDKLEQLVKEAVS